MSYWIVDGQKLTNEQYEELKKQKRLEEKNIRQETERLSQQLSQAYAALREHLEQNPDVSQEISDEQEVEQQIYYNLRRNLQKADAAPRCVFVREDGTVCRSPRMKNDIHCYAHYRMRDARADNLRLPALTDANAIQMAVMLVQRALIDDEISEKKAGLLLYSIQIAASNVDMTTFGESDEEMVTEIQPEVEVMAAHRERMEKRKKIEKAKTLPLIKTEEADLKKEQSLPRMDADERGSEEKNLPLIHTEDTDLKNGEQGLPMIHTEDTDLSRGIGKILPQSVGSGSAEVYANRGQTSEVHANLG